MYQVEVQERKPPPRKVLRRRIMLGLSDHSRQTAQTLELTAEGIRIVVERPLPVPQECLIEFSILINGQTHSVSGRARMLSCVCTGMTGFSIGMQFLELTDESRSAVSRYLGVT